MKKIYTVCNQKGGVGKTTTTLNLGLAFQERGRRVLLIDADPQGNLSGSVLGPNRPSGQSLSELIHCTVAGLQRDWSNYIHSGVDGLDIIPSSKILAAANSLLGTVSDSGMVLRAAIDTLPDCYNLVLIDCAPALDLLVINALNASSGVIIPTEPADYSIDGIMGVVETVAQLQRTSNQDLEISKVIVNKFDVRKRNHNEILTEIFEAFGGMVYFTPIPLVKEIEVSTVSPSVMRRRKDSRAWPIYQGIAEVMDCG